MKIKNKKEPMKETRHLDFV